VAEVARDDVGMGQHWRMGTKTVQSEGAGCWGVFGVPCRLGNSEVSQINASVTGVAGGFWPCRQGVEERGPNGSRQQHFLSLVPRPEWLWYLIPRTPIPYGSKVFEMENPER
jgi:hypothetical protein